MSVIIDEIRNKSIDFSLTSPPKESTASTIQSTVERRPISSRPSGLDFSIADLIKQLNDEVEEEKPEDVISRIKLRLTGIDVVEKVEEPNPFELKSVEPEIVVPTIRPLKLIQESIEQIFPSYNLPTLSISNLTHVIVNPADVVSETKETERRSILSVNTGDPVTIEPTSIMSAPVQPANPVPPPRHIQLPGHNIPNLPLLPNQSIFIAQERERIKRIVFRKINS